MFTILLLREETVAWLRGFVAHCEPSHLLELAGSENHWQTVWDILASALRSHLHDANRPWRLCGSHSQGDDVGLNANKDVLQFADRYSWCLIPWGTDYTGMMVALVSMQADIHQTAIKELQSLGCADLIVSNYTRSEVIDQRFRGVIFDRDATVRGEGIWEVNTEPTALVLTSDFAYRGRAVPAGSWIDEIKESESWGQPVKRIWVRVCDADGLAKMAKSKGGPTVLIAASDLTETQKREMLVSFDELAQDQLRVGLQSLDACSWIYVPETEYEKSEIYFSNDWRQTRRLITSEKVTTSPYFRIVCYC